jgi:hypothetical protein
MKLTTISKKAIKKGNNPGNTLVSLFKCFNLRYNSEDDIEWSLYDAQKAYRTLIRDHRVNGGQNEQAYHLTQTWNSIKRIIKKKMGIFPEKFIEEEKVGRSPRKIGIRNFKKELICLICKNPFVIKHQSKDTQNRCCSKGCADIKRKLNFCP